MSMFDHFRCSAPLPLPEFAGTEFQTKDTPNQFLDHYEIRADGTLWVECYDIEDHSDPEAEGIARIFGCMTRVNKRWEPVPDYTGTINFYTGLGDEYTGWVEFVAHVDLGKLLKPIELHEHRPIDPEEEERRAIKTREFWDKLNQENPPSPPLDDPIQPTDEPPTP